MTIRIQPVMRTYELELPLRVDDLALPPDQRGLYVPDALTRLVRIKVAGELRSQLVAFSEAPDKNKLRDWAAAHLRLHVWIPPLEPGIPYGPEIVREARLMLHGPLAGTVDRNDYELAETVSVTLRRKQ